MNPKMTSSQDQNTQNPLKPCMDMLDGFIKNGGASADDLANLKMDLEDAQSMINGEDTSEPQSEPQPGMDMAGMIQKMSNGG